MGNKKFSQIQSYDETVPVLIVGGSLVGLSLSLLLARQGISSMVVERHPSTAIHPRVAGLTARTMEIFRPLEVEADIRNVEPPFSKDSKVFQAESLVGKVFNHTIEDMSAFFADESPVKGSCIAQDILEPILRKHAEQNGVDLRYDTEMISFEQDENGVSAIIRNRSDSASRKIQADFMIGADGSKSGVRKQLGIKQHGAGTLMHNMSMVFEADIAELFAKRDAVMGFVRNENVMGAFVPYPGTSVRSNLYRLDIWYDPTKESIVDYPESRCIPLIRAAIGISNIPVKLKTVLTWEMAARVSNRFQKGRVFLVGDAARVQPPAGALGGNSGIAEAQNLAWKLAAVLRGDADHGLLNTYEMERLPIADLTVEQVTALSQQRASEEIDQIKVNTLIINMGYRYLKGAFVAEDEKDPIQIKFPNQWRGLPGSRAPYVVLGQNGKQVSTLDLYGTNFVLMVGPDGKDWIQAAIAAAEKINFTLSVHHIGAEFADIDGRFCSSYGISATGAVLVRPDGIVGWRSSKMVHDPMQYLESAFSAILLR
ncbi:FAD-dependent monooxygenase [Brevibacillus choshinensis]|uniref:FAD-dependent monooxygenase n=1 Tax=Brevibacillus choshinensis TaxID=54911 RepID=A0ABX7FV36_BRECH|nr:FAD-dependent monooxygenase [Brevibacillus choshinensis]QRG69157.1 FAD-dependent monooxygenase [Brevibacillus choshinensis]